MPNSPTPLRQVGVGRISIMKHCLVITWFLPDFIVDMGMKEEEVEVLLEAIRKGMIVQNSNHACWRQAWLNL